MKHRYGEFTENQFMQAIKSIRKQIFFLLLYVDKTTKYEFHGVDVNKAFKGLLYKLNGMNSILYYPKELVEVISLLEKARKIYLSEKHDEYFDFFGYRKCILDAGAKIMELNKNIDVYREVPD